MLSLKASSILFSLISDNRTKWFSKFCKLALVLTPDCTLPIIWSKGCADLNFQTLGASGSDLTTSVVPFVFASETCSG